MPRPRRNPATIAQSIERLLRRRGSPLAGHVPTIMRYARQYGVDPRLIVAIAGAETTFATNPAAGRDITTGHNPFGMGPHISYPTWEAGIEAATRNLRQNYLNEGRRSVVAIRDKWAPAGAANDPTGLNSSWVKNVSGVLEQLGGRSDAVGPSRRTFQRRLWRPSKFPWLPGSRLQKAVRALHPEVSQ